MAALKYSRQREAIKQFLVNSHEHPTADTIYASLRNEFPHISLGTVYRNLSLLSEIGEITRIPTGDGPDRYDGDISQHGHFICRHCHRIFDLDTGMIQSMSKEISEKYHVQIDRCVTNMYGTCGSCTK